MNYLAIALVWLAMMVAAYGAGEYRGHAAGLNEQKVADQAEIDGINQATALQKAEANALLENAKDEILDLMVDREALKDDLRKDRNHARDKTDTFTRQLAFERLRFPAAEAPGCGPGGGSPATTGAETADLGAAPLVQLPDGIAADLRQLMAKADKLKDDYAECYGYAQQVK